MIDIRALIEANRSGAARALPCFCTANEQVLRAILSHAAGGDRPTLIEATCNQVNQDGGYTGMSPSDFRGRLHALAADAGVERERLVLGGDHLGPHPWRGDPPGQAMEKARALVRLYVEAGFRKIHLDASMALGGEPPPAPALIAERAAALCAVAETHAPDPSALLYVIGTEVPVPGGETGEPDAPDVTSVERLRETIATHREAWAARGLDQAWSRIVAVVTQPGVDFGHASVHRFDPEPARPLGAAILAEPGLGFEAHSTDFQPDAALRALVENRFVFLKVGPELTFRFREAVFALVGIEREIRPAEPSRLRETLARSMDADDRHWRDHYRGTTEEITRLRSFSYSDRIRYYWSDPAVAAALSRLLANLRRAPLSETLVSQYFSGLELGDVPLDPEALIARHVQRSVGRYHRAAGGSA